VASGRFSSPQATSSWRCVVLPSSGKNGQTGEKQIELHYHLQSQIFFGRTDEARGGDDVAFGYESSRGPSENTL
jgi:hypothetical protein